MISEGIALHKRLSSKFIAMTLLLSLAPMLFLYFFSANAASSMLIESLRNDLKEKAFLVGADIDRYFSQQEHNVRMLSQADVLEGNNIEDIIQYLTEIIEETPYLDDIDIIDSNGIVIASSGEQNEKGTDVLKQFPQLKPLIDELHTAKQGQLFVSDILELDSGPGLAFLVPITDDSNTIVIKTMLVEINLDTVKKIIVDFNGRLIGDKFVYLVNNDGKVIATADPEVALLSPFPGLSTKPNLLHSFSKQGEVGSVIYTDVKGDLVIAGFADMSEFGVNKAMDWSIIAEAPVADITQPIKKFKQNLMTFTVVAFSVAAFFMFLTSRSILSSVAKLVEGARRVGAGDIKFRVDPGSGDEFGLLSKTINSTLDNLVNARENTESANIELSKSNHELRNTQSQLIQSAKLASVGELATGVAHELNQPLTIISMNTALQLTKARRGQYDKAEAIHELILKQVDRASIIINHLRTFGRESSTIEKSPNAINKIIENSFVMISEQLRLDNIEVVKELTNSLTPVNCNPIQIEQVITNIIMNAKDALTTAIPKKITIRSLIHNGNIVVEIEDTGEGIPASNLDKIFDPFFTSKDVGKGTGLGLSISYGIIENHGGCLSVRSREGEGSTFRIELPAIGSLLI